MLFLFSFVLLENLYSMKFLCSFPKLFFSNIKMLTRVWISNIVLKQYTNYIANEYMSENIF